ncbi:MAG: hypothetical protein M1536_00660, partial [Firmicutes bacterium]|nr:hypothetical protein [Bacillota bacterium]
SLKSGFCGTFYARPLLAKKFQPKPVLLQCKPSLIGRDAPCFAFFMESKLSHYLCFLLREFVAGFNYSCSAF